MEKFSKAMTAEDRILSAVCDIWNIKKSNGTASDDAVRIILNKWWIPSDSKIAIALKSYAVNTISEWNVTSVIDIANHLVEESAMIHMCRRYDIIHEVPSNGFKLPGGAGLILSKEIWFNDNGVLKSGRVDQIGFNTCSGYYDIFITLVGDSKKFSNQSEYKVFINRADLELAVKFKFI